VLVVGAYFNLHHLYPQFTLTSVQYNWQVALRQAIQDLRANHFGKKLLLITYQNGGVTDSPYYQFAADIPAKDVSKINHARANLLSGKLKLPPALQ